MKSWGVGKVEHKFDATNAFVGTDEAPNPTAKAEIEWAQKQENAVDVVLKALAKKRIPERITHNDTKFNNVMLDVESGEAMCVVDLDTVMPG